ncbi:ABC transporter permease [Nonomuraea deserti]|uniref:ABC transporter permease n=1 Tax=Nonomuraea deserti TaxID=1848322 RepID=A0A4R4VXX8_9ACTN|nr:ABC transporter permease [Nonomuraea deserti]TDD07744.1 ABC transporter permease [Nonomuraea deserti]
MFPTACRAAIDQIRTQAVSPMSLLAALAMPAVFAFILYSHTATHTDAATAVGIAGIGMLNAVIVDLLVSLSGEKRWKTLYPALSSPGGLIPLVVGRLVGVAVQSLISLPGTLLMLTLIWGMSPNFDWSRWFLGGLCLAVATTALVGLLSYSLLRFPSSPGMTNGLTGVLIALSTLLVPSTALPPFMQPIAWLVPQSHVMAWVHGGAVAELATALSQSTLIYLVILLSVRRVEHAARARAIPLEA